MKNNIKMFADDTKIWSKISSDTDSYLLQEDLDNTAMESDVATETTSRKVQSYAHRTQLPDSILYRRFWKYYNLTTYR